MTREETLDVLLGLDAEQEMEWMIALGMELTICGRGAYPFEGEPGSLEHLMGFNELHHKVYARIRDVRIGHEWTMESFFAALVQLSTHYKIGGEVRGAILRCLEKREPRRSF